MTLKDLYARPKPGQEARLHVSFELYPPRNPDSTSQAWAGIDKLLDARPDYVSVTYGTSGSTSASSQSVLTHALKRSGRPAMSHLVCLGRTKDQLVEVIHDMLDLGVRDFLALRGDEPKGVENFQPQPGQFHRAVQLVGLIREVAADYLGDPHAVSIAVAAYPAGTVQTRMDSVSALAEKQSAGADFAITQVFYDPNHYVELVQSASYQGVYLPIIPGVIPFTDAKRLARLENLTGVEVPSHLKEIAAIEDPAERTLVTLGATLDFVNDLIEAGAPGLHFYTFNRTRPVLDLVEHLRARGFGHVEHQDSIDLMELVAAAMRRLSP